MRKGLNTYREINTMGMSQVDLILTVYRGAIGFVESATTAFEAGKWYDLSWDVSVGGQLPE